MSDALRQAMADLAEEVANVDLLERTLRTSHRLRIRRIVTATVAAAAVLAVTSTTALALRGPDPGGGPDRYASPPPSASAPVEPGASGSPGEASSSTAPVSPSTPGRSSGTGSPGATTIPASAMLRAGDLAPGATASDDPTDDHGSLGMVLAYCGRDFPSWQNRVFDLGFRQRWLRSAGERYAVQQVSRQRTGVAQELIPDLRTAFGSTCATVLIGGSNENISDFAVLPSNWGDDSLLMRETPRDAGRVPAWRIAIRQGDIFTEIRTSIPGFTEAQARDLATVAAQRMCEATPTC
jgi:hypothetical protein